MDSVCAECMPRCVALEEGVGQQERAVFIQSVPCLYHVVGKTTGSQSDPRGQPGRQTLTGDEGRERSRPQEQAKKPACGQSSLS